MLIGFLIYWVLTTAYGTYWLTKHPSRMSEDPEYITALELMIYFLQAGLVAWVIIPFVLLHNIKLKR